MSTLSAEQIAHERAELTLGISDAKIYESIKRQLTQLSLPSKAVLVDIGCGCGDLWNVVGDFFGKYIGVDLVRHVRWFPEHEMVVHNLNQPGIPLPDGSADVVIACEVLPHVENPRLVVRECARICKPGGWVFVHHPNALSLLSLSTLILRQRFTGFQDDSAGYMITPLLECDLLRMARENGLEDARIFYSCHARLPFRPIYYPQWFTRRFPRLFSDNLGMMARKPVS